MFLYFEDGINARTNSVTTVGCGGVAYNAVISKPVFTDESTTEPVTLQEAKDWCRVDITDDDTLITRLIKASRISCEVYSILSFITRTVSVKINNGLGNFTLPYGPVNEIASATDYNSNDISTDFSLDTVYGQPITVEYTAGYADGELPEDLRTAVLCQIAWMYTNRGDVKLASALCLESKLILDKYRYAA